MLEDEVGAMKRKGEADVEAMHKRCAEEANLNAQRLESDLKASHKMLVDRLIEENAEQTRELNDEFVKARAIMEEQYAELQARFTSLEERFLNRESRPEDVERIRFLEAEMIKKNKEVKRVKEEMKYFKLELLNREENFNSKFGRSPNVGVMQVVKNNQRGKPGSKGRGKSGSRGNMPGAPSIDGALPPLGSQKRRPGGRPSGGRPSGPASRR